MMTVRMKKIEERECDMESIEHKRGIESGRYEEKGV